MNIATPISEPKALGNSQGNRRQGNKAGSVSHSPANHSPAARSVVHLRFDCFQQGFGNKPGFPLYKIVSISGGEPTDQTYWLQSNVTRTYMEQLGFEVVIVPGERAEP